RRSWSSPARRRTSCWPPPRSSRSPSAELLRLADGAGGDGGEHERLHEGVEDGLGGGLALGGGGDADAERVLVALDDGDEVDSVARASAWTRYSISPPRNQASDMRHVTGGGATAGAGVPAGGGAGGRVCVASTRRPGSERLPFGGRSVVPRTLYEGSSA